MEEVVTLSAEEVLVSILIAPVVAPVIAPVEQPARMRRRDRRGQRRRLDRQDRVSAQLAELHAIRVLLEQAADVVRHGWVQGSWFSVATARGQHAVTAYDLHLLVDQPVSGACLVGSVVHAAGGPATVGSQRVQRTLDVVWHALREDPDRPVRWCPGPSRRMVHVLDLTAWNDSAGRTQDEVVDLLLSARQPTERALASLTDAAGVRRGGASDRPMAESAAST